MSTNHDAEQFDPTLHGELRLALSGAESNATSEFERLYASAVPALVAWTRLRIAGLPHSRIDVEDIVQETWVRAFENLQRYSDRFSFRSWVIGIAQNVLLEALRKDVRRASDRARFEEGSGLSQCPDSITSISRAAARDDSFARLLALILELPEDERALLLMHGLEDRPLASVAERLEINEEAARKRWQRLCTRLREQPAFVSLVQD